MYAIVRDIWVSIVNCFLYLSPNPFFLLSLQPIPCSSSHKWQPLLSDQPQSLGVTLNFPLFLVPPIQSTGKFCEPHLPNKIRIDQLSPCLRLPPGTSLHHFSLQWPPSALYFHTCPPPVSFPISLWTKARFLTMSYRSYMISTLHPHPISDLTSCPPPCCSLNTKDAPISGPFYLIFPWSKNPSRCPHDSCFCLYSRVCFIRETSPHPYIHYSNCLIPGPPYSPTNSCVALNQSS